MGYFLEGDQLIAQRPSDVAEDQAARAGSDRGRAELMSCIRYWGLVLGAHSVKQVVESVLFHSYLVPDFAWARAVTLCSELIYINK